MRIRAIAYRPLTLSDALTADELIRRIMQKVPAPEKPLDTHVRIDRSADA